MESQARRILEYLQEGKSITPIDALRMFNCFRLSARIADLRGEGYTIATSIEVKEYPNGDKKRYARYWLNENA